MKIVHICLTDPMTDGWSYQENILSKYHKKLGNDVSIIASKWAWDDDGTMQYVKQSDYVNGDGIRTIRLDTLRGNVESKLKRYPGLYGILERERPDVIFLHNFQFLDAITVGRYVERHPGTVMYVDNHADYSNSAKNWISKKLLNGFLWRCVGKRITPFARMFYGVMPSRVDFLREMYRIPAEKCRLLLMGADDEKVRRAAEPSRIALTREKYGISRDDFLIVTGGKIDSFKTQTLLLMEAVKSIESERIKLIVFGSVEDSLKEAFDRLVNGDSVRYAGWLSPDDSYDLIASSDLAVFPGRHSTFWEQAAAQGIPLVCKYWEGATHIDRGGNALFLPEDSMPLIRETVLTLYGDSERYAKMKSAAERAAGDFLYSTIAQESIESERTPDQTVSVKTERRE